LNHTTLKEHVVKGQVATSPVKRPRTESAQPAFVELSLDPGARLRTPGGGDRFLGDLPDGPMLEVIRPEGERMVLRWPGGSVVDTCGLVASFMGRQ
jgi:hypothetical protein